MGAQSASQGQAASAAGAVLDRDMPRESAICVLPISAMDMANATRQDREKAPACQLAVSDAGIQKRIITCAQNELPEGMDVTEEGWSMRNQAGWPMGDLQLGLQRSCYQLSQIILISALELHDALLPTVSQQGLVCMTSWS